MSCFFLQIQLLLGWIIEKMSYIEKVYDFINRKKHI